MAPATLHAQAIALGLDQATAIEVDRAARAIAISPNSGSRHIRMAITTPTAFQAGNPGFVDGTAVTVWLVAVPPASP